MGRRQLFFCGLFLLALFWCSNGRANSTDCADNVLPPPQQGATNATGVSLANLSPQETTHLLNMLKTAALTWRTADPSDKSAAEKHTLAAQVLDPNFTEKDIPLVLHQSQHYRIQRYAKDPTQPSYSGNNYPGMKIVENSFGGLSYRSTNNDPNPIAYLMFWHGYGSNMSQGGSFLPASDIFTRPTNGFYRDLAQTLLRNKNKLPAQVKSEVIDLVNSGNGPMADQNNFADLKDFVFRMANYLRSVKDQEKLPLVIISRSASAGLLMSLVKEYPTLVDGIILIGPTHADLSVGYNSSMAAFLFKIFKGEMIGNFSAITWIDRIYKQMTWQNDPDPFHGIPSLVLVGSEDVEVSSEARQWFQEMANKYHNVRFNLMPGSDHDVLAVAGFARSRDGIENAQRKLEHDLQRSILIYDVFSMLKKDSLAAQNIDWPDEELQALVDYYSLAHFDERWGQQLRNTYDSYLKARNEEKRTFNLNKIKQLLGMDPALGPFDPPPTFAQNIVGDLREIELAKGRYGKTYNPLTAYEKIHLFLLRNFQDRFIRFLKQ